MSGIPDPLDLIAVTDASERPWLVLVSIPTWDQPQAREIEALQAPRLSVWMRLHAYLVPLAEAPRLREWAVGRDWYGLWMPGLAEPHNVLLGAHPDDPEWSAADGQVDAWEASAHGALPAEFLQCAAWYGGTGTSRDASAEEETRGYVPTRRLVDVLVCTGESTSPGVTRSESLSATPLIVSGGPAALTMRRDVVPQLAQAGLTIFWTVLIGNELHGRDHSMPGDEYRWVTASASYLIDGDRIELVGANAARCRPGPATESEVVWTPRSTED